MNRSVSGKRNQNAKKDKIKKNLRQNNTTPLMKHIRQREKEQRKKNEKNKRLESDKNKIDKLNDELKFNFDQFVKEYESKNKSINNEIFSQNNYLNQEESSIKEMLSKYSNELESQLELSKNSLKNEYEQKLQNELENLKNNILINTDDESKKYMEDKKEIENEYYSEINRKRKRI